MRRLAINTVGDELAASVQFCMSEKIGLEVTAFASPGNLDGDVAELIGRHCEVVAGISPLLSHGPFLDLVVTSPDPAIVAVAKQRHEVALAATGEIGAQFYVAHTNFNPTIRSPSYRQSWTKRMLEFWLPLADEAGERGITICLENLWEPSPDIQAELVSSGRHPRLRASFDNGHALVFSGVPSSTWVETLADTLAHCHLHDNSGELDEHVPVGDGNEEWKALIEALKAHSSEAILVAESDRLSRNKVNIERLKSY